MSYAVTVVAGSLLVLSWSVAYAIGRAHGSRGASLDAARAYERGRAFGYERCRVEFLNLLAKTEEKKA